MKIIQDFMTEDHHRLDELFQTYRETRETNSEKAKQSFQSFKKDLKKHIEWEEELLFPLFEEKTGKPKAGPPVVLRFEHREIEKLLDKIKAQLEQNDPVSEKEGTNIEELETELEMLLTRHNQKEEAVFYTLIDEIADEEEMKEIVEKIKGAP